MLLISEVRQQAGNDQNLRHPKAQYILRVERLMFWN